MVDNLQLKSQFLPLEIKTGTANPVFSKVRPLFGEKKAEIEEEILNWEKEGIIRRINKPVKWASPIHSVKKPNEKWRVCGDFRRINAITEMDRYPLPSIQ